MRSNDPFRIDVGDRLPQFLSPSSIETYRQCPKQFYYKYILGIRTPGTIHTHRGNLVHTALERLFDHERSERTVETALAYLEPAVEVALTPFAGRLDVTEEFEIRLRDAEERWNGDAHTGTKKHDRAVRDAVDLRRVLIEYGGGTPEDDLRELGEQVRRCVQRLDEEGLAALAEGELEALADQVDRVADQDEALQRGRELLLDEMQTLVRNWFELEDPQAFTPYARELYVRAQAAGVPLNGFIDRLDRIELEDGSEVYLVGDYKGLALDTPLPTPTGWTTMGAVAVGDELLGVDGRPTAVIEKSSVHTDRPCYQVRFDDGSAVVADNVHLWQIRHGQHDTEKVVNTEELAAMLADGQSLAIPAPAALQLPAAELTADPYTLGSWLADGRATSASDDLPVPSCVARATRAGQDVPHRYLRGSIEQRLALLQGLMDAGGHHDPAQGHSVFASVRPELARAVSELAVSLGGTAGPLEGVGGEADGRQVHRVWVDLPVPYEPFRAERKLAELRTARRGGQREAAGRRVVVAVEPVETVPTQCVKVDSPDSLYLCGQQMVPTHNTGKIPDDRYLSQKFFQLKVYALLLREIHGYTPAMLRLIYVKGDTKDAVKKLVINDTVLDRTAQQLKSIHRSIQRDAKTNDWDTKTGPLCPWCDFQPVCPAFNDQGEGLLAEEQELYGTEVA